MELIQLTDIISSLWMGNERAVSENSVGVNWHFAGLESATGFQAIV